MSKNNNLTLTHGLLAEDFRNNLMTMVSQHALDIQSKAIILDYTNIQIQILSQQQTQKELAEHQAAQETTKSNMPKNSEDEIKEEASE